MSRQESATNEAEAPRRHRTPQPARAQRPLVRQHGAPSSFRLEFDVRTTYDFLISMLPPEHERDVLPGDERWLTGARASLDEADRSALDMSFGSAGRGLRVQSIALHRPE
ncbi:MAG TPA: hypothetical protein VFW86_05275, partial [Candidatus Limnocylindrales bacterium]|nr:hypothetical protein [Candidatus Limnocylindrales bacterium]